MSNVYNIHVQSQMGKEHDLSGVEVDVSFPSASVYTGSDGSAARIKRAGTLRIKTSEFPGWYSAELLFLTGVNHDEEKVYEVTRHDTVPRVDNDWIEYKVMGR